MTDYSGKEKGIAKAGNNWQKNAISSKQVEYAQALIKESGINITADLTTLTKGQGAMLISDLKYATDFGNVAGAITRLRLDFPQFNL